MKVDTRVKLAIVACASALSIYAGKNDTVSQHEPSLLPEGKKFKLVWHDEFDGDRLDMTKWSFRTNFWGICFKAFATEESGAVEVKGGKVHLKLIKLPNGEFASPQLQTGELMWDLPAEKSPKGFWWLPKRDKPKFEHRYGYYECRCRLQQEAGWWSAFWMQTSTQGVCLDPARAGIEQDIMESFEPGVVLPSCFHYNGYGEDYIGFHSPRLRKSDTLTDDIVKDASVKVDKTQYHTFGLLWEPDGYTVYIDGKPRSEKVGGGKNFRGQPEAVSRVPEFLLISTEPKWYRNNRMTGKAVPELEAAWRAHDEFIVDYVRVYDIVE